MAGHEFGGEWTEQKLRILDDYLTAYSAIFERNERARFFERIYVDAFAGTGLIEARVRPQHVFQVLTKRSARLRRIAGQIEWPENVWMGVSVEDSRVLSRIDDLRGVPATLRFLSCEPLIGSLADINLRDIHWVIVGGESGPGARPMRIQWVREIFRACRNEKVPFFFKQWGGVRKDLTGRLLRGRTYDEMPARLAA